METALNEEQKAKAEKEVMQAEAVLDAHIKEYQSTTSDKPAVSGDVKESTKAYMATLEDKIPKGGHEDRLEALEEMKAMLEMMKRYEPVIEQGEKLAAADSESQCD